MIFREIKIKKTTNYTWTTLNNIKTHEVFQGEVSVDKLELFYHPTLSTPVMLSPSAQVARWKITK